MKLLGKSPLEIYLNDHLAGSASGLSLARRLADDDPVLAELADEIADAGNSVVRVVRAGLSRCATTLATANRRGEVPTKT